MKKLLLLFSLCYFFTSCATLKDDIIIQSNIIEKTQPQLTEIELQLLQQQISPNPAETQSLFEKLNDMLSTPSTDEKYLARINALFADYYILRKGNSRAKSYVETALKQNPYDEYALLVNSKLMKAQDAIDYLSNIFDRFPSYTRLGSYLGHLYFTQGEYTEAVVCFDASLPFLPEAYTTLYSNERNTSYSKYSLGTVNKTVDSILNQEKLLLQDMTTLTDETTDTLNTITGNAKWKSSMLADRLKSAGWYRSDALLQSHYTKRKDAAIFLWHLLCMGNESKLATYTNKYKSRGRSPIVDVPLGSEYFDASIAMVENDIMQLVNGKYFEPEAEISPTQFYNFLNKAKSLK